ncbi:odorant receptor 13a-like [Andrena cerasifolii]|uniref:odorant receptor 13a-like n=1 Tax=Andrena cerasifolii TaxID=2819439 RepID=UPI004037A06F
MSTEAVRMDKQSGRQIDDKPKNHHYEKDISYTLQLCKCFLKPLGLWSMIYYKTKTWEKILSVFLVMWYTFVMLFSIVPPVRFVIFAHASVLQWVQVFGMMTFSVTNCLKYCLMGLRGRKLGNCIKHMEEDWKATENPSYRAIMLKQVSMSRQLVAISAVMLYTGGMFLHVVIPLYLIQKASKSDRYDKPASHRGYEFILNSQFRLATQFVVTMQSFAGLTKYTISLCVYSLAVHFVTHIIGQIKIQISRLNECVMELQVNGRDTMGLIIRDHVEILRFSKNMQEAFYEICLIQILESTFLLCFLGFCLVTQWGEELTINVTTLIVLVISFSFNLFIFCYVGELLSNQCSEIGPAAYNIEWYNLPPKQAQNLILLSVISLYPPKLTGGKMIQFCLATFGTVMQTATIYMNLIRTVSQSD